MTTTSAQRCPVCEGRGHVPPGFYMSTAGQSWSVSNTTPERCRSCNGYGVVWRNLLVTSRDETHELTPEEVQQTARLIFGWK